MSSDWNRQTTPLRFANAGTPPPPPPEDSPARRFHGATPNHDQQQQQQPEPQHPRQSTPTGQVQHQQQQQQNNQQHFTPTRRQRSPHHHHHNRHQHNGGGGGDSTRRVVAPPQTPAKQANVNVIARTPGCAQTPARLSAVTASSFFGGGGGGGFGTNSPNSSSNNHNSGAFVAQTPSKASAARSSWNSFANNGAGGVSPARGSHRPPSAPVGHHQRGFSGGFDAHQHPQHLSVQQNFNPFSPGRDLMTTSVESVSLSDPLHHALVVFQHTNTGSNANNNNNNPHSVSPRRSSPVHHHSSSSSRPGGISPQSQQRHHQHPHHHHHGSLRASSAGPSAAGAGAGSSLHSSAAPLHHRRTSSGAACMLNPSASICSYAGPVHLDCVSATESTRSGGTINSNNNKFGEQATSSNDASSVSVNTNGEMCQSPKFDVLSHTTAGFSGGDGDNNEEETTMDGAAAAAASADQHHHHHRHHHAHTASGVSIASSSVPAPQFDDSHCRFTFMFSFPSEPTPVTSPTVEMKEQQEEPVAADGQQTNEDGATSPPHHQRSSGDSSHQQQWASFPVPLMFERNGCSWLGTAKLDGTTYSIKEVPFGPLDTSMLERRDSARANSVDPAGDECSIREAFPLSVDSEIAALCLSKESPNIVRFNSVQHDRGNQCHVIQSEYFGHGSLFEHWLLRRTEANAQNLRSSSSRHGDSNDATPAPFSGGVDVGESPNATRLSPGSHSFASSNTNINNNNALVELFVCPSEAEVWRALHDVARGLAVLHRNGFCHNNLHPRSVFVDAGGRCKVGCFGVCRKFGEAEPLSCCSSDECNTTRSRSHHHQQQQHQSAEATTAPIVTYGNDSLFLALPSVYEPPGFPPAAAASVAGAAGSRASSRGRSVSQQQQGAEEDAAPNSPHPQQNRTKNGNSKASASSSCSTSRSLQQHLESFAVQDDSAPPPPLFPLAADGGNSAAAGRNNNNVGHRRNANNNTANSSQEQEEDQEALLSSASATNNSSLPSSIRTTQQPEPSNNSGAANTNNGNTQTSSGRNLNNNNNHNGNSNTSTSCPPSSLSSQGEGVTLAQLQARDIYSFAAGLIHTLFICFEQSQRNIPVDLRDPDVLSNNPVCNAYEFITNHCQYSPSLAATIAQMVDPVPGHRPTAAQVVRKISNKSSCMVREAFCDALRAEIFAVQDKLRKIQLKNPHHHGASPFQRSNASTATPGSVNRSGPSIFDTSREASTLFEQHNSSGISPPPPHQQQQYPPNTFMTFACNNENSCGGGGNNNSLLGFAGGGCGNSSDAADFGLRVPSPMNNSTLLYTPANLAHHNSNNSLSQYPNLSPGRGVVAPAFQGASSSAIGSNAHHHHHQQQQQQQQHVQFPSHPVSSGGGGWSPTASMDAMPTPLAVHQQQPPPRSSSASSLQQLQQQHGGSVSLTGMLATNNNNNNSRSPTSDMNRGRQHFTMVSSPSCTNLDEDAEVAQHVKNNNNPISIVSPITAASNNTDSNVTPIFGPQQPPQQRQQACVSPTSLPSASQQPQQQRVPSAHGLVGGGGGVANSSGTLSHFDLFSQSPVDRNVLSASAVAASAAAAAAGTAGTGGCVDAIPFSGLNDGNSNSNPNSFTSPGGLVDNASFSGSLLSQPQQQQQQQLRTSSTVNMQRRRSLLKLADLDTMSCDASKLVASMNQPQSPLFGFKPPASSFQQQSAAAAARGGSTTRPSSPTGLSFSSSGAKTNQPGLAFPSHPLNNNSNVSVQAANSTQQQQMLPPSARSRGVTPASPLMPTSTSLNGSQSQRDGVPPPSSTPIVASTPTPHLQQQQQQQQQGGNSSSINNNHSNTSGSVAGEGGRGGMQRSQSMMFPSAVAQVPRELANESPATMMPQAYNDRLVNLVKRRRNFDRITDNADCCEWLMKLRDPNVNRPKQPLSVKPIN